MLLLKVPSLALARALIRVITSGPNMGKGFTLWPSAEMRTNGSVYALYFLKLLKNTSSWNSTSHVVSGSDSGGSGCLNPTIGVFRKAGSKSLMSSNAIGASHLKRMLCGELNNTNLTRIPTKYWMRLSSDEDGG